MSAWIPTTKSLPRGSLKVEIQLPDGSVTKAQIEDVEYDETMWVLDDGRKAHFVNYSDEDRKRWQVINKPDTDTPVAWRRIKEQLKI